MSFYYGACAITISTQQNIYFSKRSRRIRTQRQKKRSMENKTIFVKFIQLINKLKSIPPLKTEKWLKWWWWPKRDSHFFYYVGVVKICSLSLSPPPLLLAMHITSVTHTTHKVFFLFFDGLDGIIDWYWLHVCGGLVCWAWCSTTTQECR